MGVITIANGINKKGKLESVWYGNNCGKQQTRAEAGYEV